tara:strand:+ start:178812 stop:179888 length:1077 start_codon:yes stop_codon:yes gene_type:complete
MFAGRWLVACTVLAFGAFPVLMAPYAAGDDPNFGEFIRFDEPGTQFRSTNPFGIDVRGDDIWITTVGDHRVFHTVAGKDASSHAGLTLVAGNGKLGYSGDDGPASEAEFNWPHEVRADEQNNLFIADTRNHVIRRIDGETGVVTTLAGNGQSGFQGDGQSGSQVKFDNPHSIVLDQDGGLLVADTKNHRIRRIDLESGVVQTVCGTGKRLLPTDGADASTSPLFGPRSLAVDDDSIWIALREGNSIWRINRGTNTIHHVAGSGKKGDGGDGGPLADAMFNGPKGIVLDQVNGLAIVDTENHSIRRIDVSNGSLETILGGSRAKATLSMKRPHGIAYHPTLGLLIADSENDRVLFIRGY